MQKIMFNDQYRLNKAVLEGWKTNTRRIIPQSVIDKAEEYRVEYYNQTFDAISLEDILVDVEHLMGYKSLSRFKVGEEIAVAQNYNDVFHIVDDNKRAIIDKIDCNNKGWSNKMFVKAKYMPHKIKITNVRVERLQDISEEDCLKEGIYECIVDNEGGAGIRVYTFGEYDKEDAWKTPKHAFAALIDKVSGKGTWDSNPLVFVYEFELVK